MKKVICVINLIYVFYRNRCLNKMILMHGSIRIQITTRRHYRERVTKVVYIAINIGSRPH